MREIYHRSRFIVNLRQGEIRLFHAGLGVSITAFDGFGLPALRLTGARRLILKRAPDEGVPNEEVDEGVDEGLLGSGHEICILPR